MTYTDESDEDRKVYQLRYDPRGDEGKLWTLMKPSFESLSKKEKKALTAIQKDENSDDMLVYDKLKVDFETATLLSTDEERATYRVPLVDEDMPRKMREAIRMEITVNKSEAYVEKVALNSEKPFKPAPIAKLERFLQVQEYAPVSDGIVLLQSSQSEVSGKAMLKKFNSKTMASYSDFERIEGLERNSQVNK